MRTLVRLPLGERVKRERSVSGTTMPRHTQGSECFSRHSRPRRSASSEISSRGNIPTVERQSFTVAPEVPVTRCVRIATCRSRSTRNETATRKGRSAPEQRVLEAKVLGYLPIGMGWNSGSGHGRALARARSQGNDQAGARQARSPNGLPTEVHSCLPWSSSSCSP